MPGIEKASEKKYSQIRSRGRFEWTWHGKCQASMRTGELAPDTHSGIAIMLN